MTVKKAKQDGAERKCVGNKMSFLIGQEEKKNVRTLHGKKERKTKDQFRGRDRFTLRQKSWNLKVNKEERI